MKAISLYLEHSTGETTNVIFVIPRRPKQGHRNLSLLGYYVCFSDDDKMLVKLLARDNGRAELSLIHTQEDEDVQGEGKRLREHSA